MTHNIHLTKRERQALELLSQGLTMSATADAMGVARKTVATYSYRLYSKIGVHDRTRLAHYALHHGLVGNVFAEATKADSRSDERWQRASALGLSLGIGR